MAKNVHIEHIGDTESNVRTNLDLLQIAILTDISEEFVWSNNAGDKLKYAAMQYYWNGSVNYEDNDMGELTLHDDLLVDEYIKRASGTDDYIRFENDKLSIAAGGNVAMVFEDNLVYSLRNVGIGTTSPQAELHVIGDIVGKNDDTSNLGCAARRWANLYMASTVDYAANLYFDEAGSTKVTFLTGGNVGIGSTQPAVKLDVVGALILNSGTSVNKFSTDVNLAGDSDDTVPTEKAVKAYVASEVSSGKYWSRTGADVHLKTITDTVGIGTTCSKTSNNLLNIAHSGNMCCGAELTNYNSDGVVGSCLYLSHSRNNSIGTLTETIDTDVLGTVIFNGVPVGAANMNYGAFIRVTQLGAAGGTYVPTLMELNTANSTAMSVGITIDENGNVGIGTTNPLQDVCTAAGDFTGDGLHVKSDISSDNQAYIILEGDNTGALGHRAATLLFADNAGAVDEKMMHFSFTSVTEPELEIATINDSAGARNGLLQLKCDSQIWNFINCNLVTLGDVGIGTTTPQAKLHVIGDIVGKDDDTSDLGSSARRWANLYMASTIDYGTSLYFKEAAADTVTFLTGGNVGIGTTNPKTKLQVEGVLCVSPLNAGKVGIGTTKPAHDGLHIVNTTTTQITSEFTNNDATAGPKFQLFRDSASPAISDYLGEIEFEGEDGSSNKVTYAHIGAQILGIAGNGGINGQLLLGAMHTGSDTYQLTIQGIRDNIGIMTTTFDAQATGTLAIKEGVCPAAATADQIYLWCQDDSGTAECYVQDGSGNQSKISPHNEDGEWEFYSKNVQTGKIIRIHLEKFFKYFDEKFKTNFVEESIEI